MRSYRKLEQWQPKNIKNAMLLAKVKANIMVTKKKITTSKKMMKLIKNLNKQKSRNQQVGTLRETHRLTKFLKLLS